MSSIVAAIMLTAGMAAAQTPLPPATGGAFESLSPGNQKIALAIFDSERRAGRTAATRTLSLDEIAGMKQNGKGWGEVFKEMKSQGLVQDRNLGQAVSRVSRGGGATAARTEITTASGKTAIVGDHQRSGAALTGRRGFGSDDARGDAETSAVVSHGRDGGDASAARGGAGSHGGGRGR
jgi:hypothetical protein